MPVVAFDNLAAQIETQARAADALGIIGATKALKHQPMLRSRNADAMVCHAKSDGIRCRIGVDGYHDLGRIRAIFDRIVDEIIHHLLDAQGVNRQKNAWLGGMQTHGVVLGRDLLTGDGTLHQRHKVMLARVQI